MGAKVREREREKQGEAERASGGESHMGERRDPKRNVVNPSLGKFE